MAMIKTRILVIEDTADLCYELVDYLRFRGYDAHGVGSVAGMRQCLDQESWQVLVLDLSLPDGEGTAAAQYVRQCYGLNVGIVMATARGQVDDRVLGLQSGADAYLVKPVDLRELCAVIDRLAQRVQERLVRAPKMRAVNSQWVLLRAQHRLQCPDGQEVALTGTEYLVLDMLLLHPGEAIGRDILQELINPGSASPDTRWIDALIGGFRNKVREETGQELPLHTYRNLGYAFES